MLWRLSAQQDHRTWRDYGGGPDSSHFVALDQINKSNVNQLQVTWTYPTGDNGSYVFNPIIVDKVMYVLARKSSLVALDAATGREIWIHENLPGLSTRGITYWESRDRKDRRLIFAINNYLEEINAETGRSILTFGKQGLVDLKEGLGRNSKTIVRIQSNTPGRVFENLILIGSATGEGYLSPPGDIRAFNVVTGRMIWIFHTIPHPGEPGYDTWPKDAWKHSGGTNTWGEITLDEKRGIAYFPIGSPTYDYLRCRPGGKQSVFRLPARPERPYREALVAFPNGQPRSLGLRCHSGTATGECSSRRENDRRRGAAHQAGFSVRVRSSVRQAFVAHRRASGSEERHAWRTRLAHATVPHCAATFRTPEDDLR
jgi:glucose dehydrogenase